MIMMLMNLLALRKNWKSKRYQNYGTTVPLYEITFDKPMTSSFHETSSNTVRHTQPKTPQTCKFWILLACCKFLHHFTLFIALYTGKGRPLLLLFSSQIFQEELDRRKMVGLIDVARDNEELSPETRFLIYDLDDKWNNLNNWSEERLDKLNRINVDWKNLREQERGLLDVIDDNDSRLKLMSSPVDLSDKLETENQRNELKVSIVRIEIS